MLRSPWTAPLLIAACIFLLPFGRSVELPMTIMAVAGLVRLVRQPREVTADPAVRLLALLFACFWLPMLLALPDAVSFDRALSTTLVFLRFPLMAVYMLHTLRDPASLGRIGLALTAVLGFWTVDALIQLGLGTDLFGFPYDGGRLRGIYYPEHKLGNVMAMLAPVYAAGLVQLSKRWHWAWLALLPYLAVVLLSGSRTSWLMLAFGLLAYGAILFYRASPALRRKALAAILFLGVLAGAGLGLNPAFQDRLSASAGLLSGDYEQVNQASSLRLPIWQAGLKMFRDHWLNGIGPRGFRNLYPQYAEPGDVWIAKNPKQGPTHPHQMTLEIGVETGAIGLVGLALFWLWWLRRWWAARLGGDPQLPWLAALGVALLPLNAGHAFYASFMSGIAFLLLALVVAAGRPDAPHA